MPVHPEPTPLSPQLLGEAADWIMLLRFGTASERERLDFERWRTRSPAHIDAWRRVESMLGTFDQVPSDVGRHALQSLRSMNRRRALRLLASMLVALPVGWLLSRRSSWDAWTADVATAVGERRSLTLPDGSLLVLNTASAIDIEFTDTQRLIVLRAGEILLTTHKDPAPVPRPLRVQVPQGTMRALGTRFSVRRDGERSQVAVFEQAVEVSPRQGVAEVLRGGQAASFDATGVQASEAVDDTAALWEHGMLVAKDMRLDHVVAELARYRRGVLRCDPAVAGLRVSGALSVADTDAGLLALERTLPVRVSRTTPYWVSVQPR